MDVYDHASMVRVGIIGASGYTGVELLRNPDLVFSEFDEAATVGLDLVFLGLPHEASMRLAPQLVGKVGCVVDLSAAFRLKDAAAYPRWYGFEHEEPALLAEAVYGLPERTRGELPGARL